MSTQSSAEVVRQFFAAFGKGDLEAVVAAFHPDAQIVAVRKGARGNGELYGTYRGRDGARAFISNLGKTFDTQAFTVDAVVGEGTIAFASGSFTHKVKATGRSFGSDWALRCVVEGGTIAQYHFFEDSAAFVAASRADDAAWPAA